MSRRSSVSSIASSATGQNRKEQQKVFVKADGMGMDKSSVNPFLAQDVNRSRLRKSSSGRSAKKPDQDTSVISKLQKFNNLLTKEDKPASLLSASADPVLSALSSDLFLFSCSKPSNFVCIRFCCYIFQRIGRLLFSGTAQCARSADQ